jgi:hypothetical protein
MVMSVAFGIISRGFEGDGATGSRIQGVMLPTLPGLNQEKPDFRIATTNGTNPHE